MIPPHTANHPVLTAAWVLGVLIGRTGDCLAQRPPPQVVEYGLPSSGTTVAGRLVAWAYWGVKAQSCSRVSAGIQCTLSLGNGSDEAHILCLGDVVVQTLDRADTAVLSSTFPRDARRHRYARSEQRVYSCVTVDPHSSFEVTLRSARALIGKPAALAITLVEQWRRPGRDSSLEAQAVVPIREGEAEKLPR